MRSRVIRLQANQSQTISKFTSKPRRTPPKVYRGGCHGGAYLLRSLLAAVYSPPNQGVPWALGSQSNANAQHKRNRSPWVGPRPMWCSSFGLLVRPKALPGGGGGGTPLWELPGGGEMHSREASLGSRCFPTIPCVYPPGWPPTLETRLCITLKVLGVNLLVVKIGKIGVIF